MGAFNIQSVILMFLLFVAGEIILIRGYKKYHYSLAWVLVPFVGVILSFPVYFGLKEAFFKNSRDEVKAKIAHKQLIAGIWFIVAIILWIMISGVTAIFPGLSTGNIDSAYWMQLLCFGLYAICLIYLIIVLLLRRK